MNKKSRIRNTLSTCQWEIVYSKVTMGKKEVNKHKALRSYVQAKLTELEAACSDMPDTSPCMECKELVSIFLPDSSFEKIRFISQKTGISDPGSVILKFIITPLLVQH